VLLHALRQSGYHCALRRRHSLLSTARRPKMRRSLHADQWSCGLGGQEEEPAPLRDPHRMEVLWQRDGLEEHVRRGRAKPRHLRRGVLWHRQQPHPREGRHVGCSGLAAGTRLVRRQSCVYFLRPSYSSQMDCIYFYSISYFIDKSV